MKRAVKRATAKAAYYRGTGYLSSNADVEGYIRRKTKRLFGLLRPKDA